MHKGQLSFLDGQERQPEWYNVSRPGGVLRTPPSLLTRISKCNSEEISSSSSNRLDPAFVKWQIIRSELMNSAFDWIDWLLLRKIVRCQEAPLKRPGWIKQLNREEFIKPLPEIAICLQSLLRRSQRPSSPIFSNRGGFSDVKKDQQLTKENKVILF